MCDRITNGCSVQYCEFGPKNGDVQQDVAGMVIQKVRNCILLLHLCFSNKKKKEKKKLGGNGVYKSWCNCSPLYKEANKRTSQEFQVR